MVSHGHRDRIPVCGHGHDHVVAFAVLDRVDQQVTQDALDPAVVRISHAGLGGQPELDPRAAPLGQLLGVVGGAAGDVTDVHRVRIQRGRVGVVPADLQQVLQQRLEPVQLALEQLGRPGADRVEGVLGFQQHIGGHLDRGQRGAELVRDVGHELPLQLRQLLELAQLVLQAGRHVVERRGQRGQVVRPADPHPLAETAGRQPLGRLGGMPDRDHHPAGDQRGDQGQQHDQGQPGTDQRALDQRQCLLLLDHREQVVQLVVVAQRGADGQAGLVAPAERGHDDRRRVVDLARPEVVLFGLHAGGQGGRDTRRVGPAGDTSGVSRGTDQLRLDLDDHDVAAVVAAGVLQFLRSRVQEVVRDRGRGGRPGQVGVALGHGQALGHLGRRGLLLVQQQAVRNLLGQEEPEHRDDQRGQRQRGRDHPQLERPAPAAAELVDPLPLPLAGRLERRLGLPG